MNLLAGEEANRLVGWRASRGSSGGHREASKLEWRLLVLLVTVLIYNPSSGQDILTRRSSGAVVHLSGLIIRRDYPRRDGENLWGLLTLTNLPMVRISAAMLCDSSDIGGTSVLWDRDSLENNWEKRPLRIGRTSGQTCSRTALVTGRVGRCTSTSHGICILDAHHLEKSRSMLCRDRPGLPVQAPSQHATGGVRARVPPPAPGDKVFAASLEGKSQ